MNLLIDIHTHLDHPLLINKIDEIIQSAKNAGLKHIITNGINPETNRICSELSKKYDIVKCAMGLYPRSALKREIELRQKEFDEFLDRLQEKNLDQVRASIARREKRKLEILSLGKSTRRIDRELYELRSKEYELKQEGKD